MLVLLAVATVDERGRECIIAASKPRIQRVLPVPGGPWSRVTSQPRLRALALMKQEAEMAWRGGGGRGGRGGRVRKGEQGCTFLTRTRKEK
jgi:hypothetical protein